MAEMLIKSESLTSIADKIRVLSGTEDVMSLNTMNAHIDEANTDIATEANLIAQIASALEGKAADGGGSSESDNTITILNNTNADLRIGGYELSHGKSIKIPYNIPVTTPLVFATKLPVGTVINATNALMSTQVSEADVSIGNGITLPVKIICIIPSASMTTGSMVEIYVQ